MTTKMLPRRKRITSPTSIVQLDYPDHQPSPKPAGSYTRFVLISDTHSQVFPVPDGDVLLHSGDLTRRGTLRDLHRTMDWLYALPHPIKIIIAGNRDFALDREWYDKNWEHTGHPGKPAIWEHPDPIFELLTGSRAKAANVIYLRDEKYSFTAGGREWTVYGTPRSPNFGARVRAFGYDSADATSMVSAFPETDILMTHGPPHGILDQTTHNAFAGCPALTSRIISLRPRLHVFGHIHESRGCYVHEWSEATPSAQNPASRRIAEDEEKIGGNGQQTIFVNAANTPKLASGGVLPPVGGSGFQPIVVDLLN
ncbi:Metallophos domain-containing protein [Mycena indigotica]|uniref:Metallophos domain-containing protein n=1 Tax=Mycena indigotica TaxID=2126181 RepID=A0A8H6VS94_9AGAR|nr:Metallophos domain-containing protein [Mycena indigotica]KAF7291929.1 Metallophos domain-containing protein [Mycena indigotica]